MFKKVWIVLFLRKALSWRRLLYFSKFFWAFFFSWLLLLSLSIGGFRKVLLFFKDSSYSFLDLLDFLLCFSNSSSGVCITSRSKTRLSNWSSADRLLGVFSLSPAFLIKYRHVLSTKDWSIFIILMSSLTLFRPYCSTYSIISGVITSEPLSTSGFLFWFFR